MTLQKTNHGTRETLEAAGIGMQSAATYVDSHFNSEALARLKALNRDAIKWQHGQRAVITRGKWGSLVRFAQVSEDGTLISYKGKDGETKIVSTDILEQGFAILTMMQLVELVTSKGAQGMAVVVQRNTDAENGVEAGAQFAGFICGNLKDSYSSLIFAHNGKLCAKDLEFKSNIYNEAKLISLGDCSKNDAMAGGAIERMRNAAIRNDAKLVRDEGEKRKGKSAKVGGGKKKKTVEIEATTETLAIEG